MIYVGGTSTATSNGFSGTTVDLTTLTGGIRPSPEEGDLVVIAVSQGRDGSVNPGTTFTLSGGYDNAGYSYGNDDFDVMLGVFTKVMTDTPDTGVTITASPGSYPIAIVVHVWRGVEPTSIFDATPITASNGGNARPNPGPITPSAVGAVVLAIGANPLTNSETWPIKSTSSGYINSIIRVFGVGGGTSIGICSKVWASGSEDPGAFNTVSTNSSFSWAAITLALKPGLPQIVTEDITDITLTSASVDVNVVSNGGYIAQERGVVWSTSPNPTTSNFKSVVSGNMGQFSAPITGLTPGQTYFVRGYIINATGTYYGNELEFSAQALPDNQIALDINGVTGATYAVQLFVGGSAGTVTVRLGTTGYSQVINAGEGIVTLQGVYSGANGIIIEADDDFDGYIDHVYYVLVVGDAPIDWSLSTLTNIFPINSSVAFKRIESNEFNNFTVYRYLDIQFKDLDAYVTILLKSEANENQANSGKTFLVSNESEQTLPFVKKRISMLKKNQAMIVQLSNDRLDERFTVCKFIVKGFIEPKRQFDSNKIISML
jgi:hypothetical protein